MKSRRYDYDLLRVLSMLGVVYLHTAAGALRSFSYHSLWNFSNLISVLVTPAVPLFFMMSGALLLSEDKTSDLDQLFRRRIPKVLVPLLCWSGVTLAYNFLRGDPQATFTSLTRLLNTPVLVPYWFLYALIPMYLISPLLKAMPAPLPRRQWDYMMALWVVLTLGLYTVRSFVPDAWELVFTEHWTLNLNMIGGYLGYFLLGAYLERLEKLPSRKVLAGAVVFLVAFAAVGTRWDTYDKMMYSDRFTNYLTLFTMALSVSIFLLAKSCLRGKEEKGRLLPLLAGNSFCVYLLHPLVLRVGEKLWTRFTGLLGPANIGQQVFFYLCIAVVCIVGSILLSSIPGLCYLFTGQTWKVACKSSNLRALFTRREP